MKSFNRVLIIAVLIIVQNANSQNDSLKGKTGLVYSFSGLNLNGGLGGKYWLTSNDAFRINFYGTYRKYPTNDYKEYSLSTRFGYEHHLNSIDIVSPYIGGSVGYDYMNNTTLFRDSYILEGFIGVEIWVYKSITLSAEQELSFLYFPKKFGFSEQFLIETKKSYLTASIYF